MSNGVIKGIVGTLFLVPMSFLAITLANELTADKDMLVVGLKALAIMACAESYVIGSRMLRESIEL